MNYYEEIKKELVNNELYKRAKYGDGLIKEYSKKLIADIGKQYNYKILFKMRKFYLTFEKLPTVSRQLTWSHYLELLKFSDIDKINYLFAFFYYLRYNHSQVILWNVYKK